MSAPDTEKSKFRVVLDEPEAPKKKVIAKANLADGVYEVVNGELRLVKPKAKPEKKKQYEMGYLAKKAFSPREGSFYKTADGRKAQIWKINKTSDDFPIVGMVEQDGIWVPRIWSKEGETKVPHGRNNNLVAGWSET